MRPCLHVGSVVQVCGSLLFHWAHRCWITLGSAEQLATESVGGACESEIFFSAGSSSILFFLRLGRFHCFCGASRPQSRDELASVEVLLCGRWVNPPFLIGSLLRVSANFASFAEGRDSVMRSGDS